MHFLLSGKINWDRYVYLPAQNFSEAGDAKKKRKTWKW